MAKNIAFFALAGGLWLGLSTGYFSPDRPTRWQWDELERLKKRPTGTLVYKSDFATESPGEAKKPAGYWYRYNEATIATVQFDPGGVTVKYEKEAWIGVAFRFLAWKPGGIYRITIDRAVEGEPGALLVRNRQMDIEREQIPVGSGPFKVEFVAPRARLDVVDVVFIPDGRKEPQGTMRISSMIIERLGD